MNKIIININECKGCARCTANCPKQLIRLSKNINRFGLQYVKVDNPDSCIGCGQCFYACPEPGAIAINMEK